MLVGEPSSSQIHQLQGWSACHRAMVAAASSKAVKTLKMLTKPHNSPVGLVISSSSSSLMDKPRHREVKWLYQGDQVIQSICTANIWPEPSGIIAVQQIEDSFLKQLSGNRISWLEQFKPLIYGQRIKPKQEREERGKCESPWCWVSFKLYK